MRPGPRAALALAAAAGVLAGCLGPGPAGPPDASPPGAGPAPVLPPPPSELEALDAYLARFDVREGLAHCARVGGVHNFQDAPALPVQHVNGTNSLLDMHAAWHTEHVRLQERADFADDANPYGDVFVRFHRHMLEAYDAWRAGAGFAPLPPWDPALPIPGSMAYDPGPPCRSRATEDPGVARPAWLDVAGGAEQAPLFGYLALCDFPSLNRLAKAVDFDGEATLGSRLTRDALHPPLSYHSQVHEAVRGDFLDPTVSPRDPAFWAWHKFLDHQFRGWERACAGAGA